jgi:hypothetical protein
MMTDEVGMLEVIPAEFDEQGFGLDVCTVTCKGQSCDFSCLFSCTWSG